MQRNNICKFVVPEQKTGLSVYCFVMETDPAIICKKVQLSAHKMILVTKGEGLFRHDDGKTPFSAGNLLFGFRDEDVCIDATENCEYLYILFDGDRAEEIFRRFDIHKNNRAFSGFDSLIPFWKESLSRADAQTVDLSSESVLLYTFSRLSAVNTLQNSLFHALTNMIETHFNDPELTINVIAEELSYNPKYLSHLFKEKMGIGFSEYLRTTRIKYAISLFNHGIDSVKNVALLSGFTDPLYFSTVFKKEVGLSPKEYISSREQ